MIVLISPGGLRCKAPKRQAERLLKNGFRREPKSRSKDRLKSSPVKQEEA